MVAATSVEAGVTVPPELASVVAERSEGLPLLVEELLSVSASGMSRAVPASIADTWPSVASARCSQPGQGRAGDDGAPARAGPVDAGHRRQHPSSSTERPFRHPRPVYREGVPGTRAPNLLRAVPSR